MKRGIRVVLWSAGALIAVVAILFFAFCWMYSNSYSWDRDKWNQEKIAKAYISYYADKTNFPSSLATLVKAGYLPEKAEWYKEPPGFFAHPVDFKESSYVVQPPESGNVENMKMIGSRMEQNGKVYTNFTTSANATVRDTLKQLRKRVSS